MSGAGVCEGKMGTGAFGLVFLLLFFAYSVSIKTRDI